MPIMVPRTLASTPQEHLDDHDILRLLNDSTLTWTAYVPTLTASVSNPTLGVASIAVGRYLRIGSLVRTEIHIKFGTSGTNAGSGDYRISLPVTAVAPLRVGGLFPIGIGLVNVGGLLPNGSVIQLTTTTVGLRLNTATSSADAGHVVPAAWGANGEMMLSFTYQAA